MLQEGAYPDSIRSPRGLNGQAPRLPPQSRISPHGLVAAETTAAKERNAMPTKARLLTGIAAVACFLVGSAILPAQAQTAALSGQVSSPEEAVMEGVVVSAKKEGSTIAISVVSDAQGKFSFPADRLEPGKYTLKARAAGYELDGAKSPGLLSAREAKADLN